MVDEDGAVGDVEGEAVVSAEELVKDPRYPIKVVYCPECTRPLEFCEYSEDYATCLQTIHDKMPELFEQMNLSLDLAKGDLLFMTHAQNSEMLFV